ncbi:hypothetical protein DOTSEDRAFT_71108 [Dothistroma septosporum NZE10]|uniref:Peroxisomal membrane protein Pex17 n=1 Tax=Dothistroma septosporum (strain NZE10 / CBS 128990) TaxID=675120 RepID=N1PS95_DOTSN|nr:hypothetical protein DOTSEDRAFT_71108 [Dothistroma septosporum NZE10]
MPADRLLGTLLRALQTYAEQEDTPRLFGTASSLLTTLNNPLNVTLLTSQILLAPAIWLRPEGLRTCMRCLSVFHAAARALLKHEDALIEGAADQDSVTLQPERTLPKDEWIKAALGGADEHSPRWRHTLVIAGLLLGFGRTEDENLSQSMRDTLGTALVTATNLALEETPEDDELGLASITLALNHCFPYLPNHQRAQLDYGLVLPVLVRATLHSSEGLQSAYFLGALDRDVLLQHDDRLEWSEQSASYQHIQATISSPLIGSLGPLARLIGHSIEQVKESWRVNAVLNDLETFAKTLHTQWRQNKLSSVEVTEQQQRLSERTLNITVPTLWSLLQSVMFASVIVLRSALGRLLGDSTLANDVTAPTMAKQSLYILRSFYFVTTRQGPATFSQYNFVSYSAMDILGQYPLEAQSFLRDIRPTYVGNVAEHPLERNLDLFFLNTAEHFTLVLPPHVSEELLLPTVTCYLAAGGKGQLLSIFEAAHSVTLAVFSAPQNADATINNLPLYVDSLFKVFPLNLSARQFRLAFRTLLKLTSPPSSLSLTRPMMPAILLELLHERAQHSSTTPIPIHSGTTEAAVETPDPLSEQAVLTLTVLDGLTQVPLDLLDEWLPLTAEMIHAIQDGGMREHCQQHFWHILTGGELDPERSRVCHAWWSNGGGKEWILYADRGDDDDDDDALMSGGLQGGQESKL